MTEPSLTPRDRAILFALMALDQSPVTNAVLKDRVNMTLDGGARRRLNELGLVESIQPGRAYEHELTDEGWAWCRKEMSAAYPTGSDGGTRVLYLMMAGLDRYMERESLQLVHVFHTPSQPDISSDAAQERIRAAYQELAGEPGRDWVSLTSVRAHLSDLPWKAIDEALLRLEREPDVNVAPNADQKSLTPADRAAAIKVGGKNKHLLMIREPQV